MTLLSHSLMPPTEGGVGFGTDHRIARFPHITFLAYSRSHLWLGKLTERQGCTTPQFFFWQPTIGHIARFKVTETPSTNMGAGADNSFSELYKKARASVPEVDNIRRQLLETGTQGTPENPSLSGLQGSSFWGLLLGHQKVSLSGPQGEGCAGQWLSWEGGEEEGRAVPSDPSRGRLWKAKGSRQERPFSEVWLGGAPLPLSLRL